MDGGPADGHIFFNGGQITLEDIRVRIHICDREEIGPRRWKKNQGKENR